MTFIDWLKSWRREPVTFPPAGSIREQMAAAQEQLMITCQQRDLVALDAATDEAAAQRWTHLDDSARALTRRLDMLATALRDAEEREAAEHMRQEEARLTQALADYHAATASAQQWLDEIVTRLPHADDLTTARDLQRTLAEAAGDLRRNGVDDVLARRPFNPLASLRVALDQRIATIDRAKAFGDRPLRIGRGTNEDALAAAVERVGKVDVQGAAS